MNPAQLLNALMMADPEAYGKRVQELEDQGLTTSDAQGVADAELLDGGLKLGE